MARKRKYKTDEEKKEYLKTYYREYRRKAKEKKLSPSQKKKILEQGDQKENKNSDLSNAKKVDELTFFELVEKRRLIAGSPSQKRKLTMQEDDDDLPINDEDEENSTQNRINRTKRIKEKVRAYISNGFVRDYQAKMLKKMINGKKAMDYNTMSKIENMLHKADMNNFYTVTWHIKQDASALSLNNSAGGYSNY